jgi:hypothetical protein
MDDEPEHQSRDYSDHQEEPPWESATAKRHFADCHGLSPYSNYGIRFVPQAIIKMFEIDRKPATRSITCIRVLAAARIAVDADGYQ